MQRSPARSTVWLIRTHTTFNSWQSNNRTRNFPISSRPGKATSAAMSKACIRTAKDSRKAAAPLLRIVRVWVREYVYCISDFVVRRVAFTRTVEIVSPVLLACLLLTSRSRPRKRNAALSVCVCVCARQSREIFASDTPKHRRVPWWLRTRVIVRISISSADSIFLQNFVLHVSDLFLRLSLFAHT